MSQGSGGVESSIWGLESKVSTEKWYRVSKIFVRLFSFDLVCRRPFFLVKNGSLLSIGRDPRRWSLLSEPRTDFGSLSRGSEAAEGEVPSERPFTPTPFSDRVPVTRPVGSPPRTPKRVTTRKCFLGDVTYQGRFRRGHERPFNC